MEKISWATPKCIRLARKSWVIKNPPKKKEKVITNNIKSNQKKIKFRNKVG